MEGGLRGREESGEGGGLEERDGGRRGRREGGLDYECVQKEGVFGTCTKEAVTGGDSSAGGRTQGSWRRPAPKGSVIMQAAPDEG